MYAIFKDDSGMFRITSMPGKFGTFESRAPLFEEWRGLKGEELKKVSQLDDIEFVHHAGFTGGAKSFKTCLRMGEVSLEQIQKKKNEVSAKQQITEAKVTNEKSEENTAKVV